jgi:glyoxylase-like metal-dependent hydrolase (beta-lactamase superfamily II)
MPAPHPALDGLSVLERGWLSSNNVLLHGAPGEGATLVDSGHCAHAAQTLALVRHSLRDEPLSRLVNTHLHSDHCGGNATLQRAFGMPVLIPPGQWEAVLRWDEDALSYRPSRQRCERFTPDAQLVPGETLRCGGRAWQVLAAPGHDPDSVMLFDAAHGVLISADALWENGFGIVFPELDGEMTAPSSLRSLPPGGAQSAWERPGAD